MKLFAIVISGDGPPVYYWPNVEGGVTTDFGAARKFSTAGDAVAFLHTMSDGKADHADFPIVPVPPAAMLQAEAAARAEWIGRGGKVRMGEAGL